MTTIPAPARAVSRAWESLVPDRAASEAFAPSMVSGLPDAAQRFLLHSIPPGAAMWRSAELAMRGQIRIGSWRGFAARQVLTPGAGYVWAATASFFGLPVSGYDRYSAGTGEMRWRLLGVVPVVTVTGADVSRSAAGRLAAEGIFVPTTFDLAEWADGPSPDLARCTWRVGDHEDTVDLHVGSDGTVREARMQRWWQAGKTPGQRRLFGVTVHAERRWSGVTIPTRFTGWWDTPGDGDFFRAEITAAAFR